MAVIMRKRVGLHHISIAVLLSPVVGKSFKMKVQLLFLMAVIMGLAYSLDTCCQHPAGVKRVGDKCDVASQEELDSCTEECPLKGCDPMTLIQCAGTLFKCGSICIKQLIPPSQDCMDCFGSLFQQCFHCLQP